MGTRPFCRKCLLDDIDDKKILDEIKQAIDRLDDGLKVSEEEYRSRLDVCKACDRLNAGTCMACGCYVELRAAAVSGKCPYKKW